MERNRLTDEEETKVALTGDCPICGAEDGEPCRRDDGKSLNRGKLHVGRLRKQKAN